jgi:hypothetical protein
MAFYIKLENEDAGFDPYVNGKALARLGEDLEMMAERAGVPPLMSFFSASREDLGEFLDEEEMGAVTLPPEQWFSAETGLKTVRALWTEAGNAPEFEPVKSDLREFERVLQQAQAKGIRWHLAIDS